MTYTVSVHDPNSKSEIHNPFAELQTGVYDNWRIQLHNGQTWILDGANEGVRVNLSGPDATVTVHEPGNRESVRVEDVALIEWRGATSHNDE